MVGVIVASEVRASAMIYCWLWEVNKYDVGMRMKIRENQSTGTYFGKVARVCVCARAHTHTHTQKITVISWLGLCSFEEEK